jgi:phage terminase large subunit-like protein
MDLRGIDSKPLSERTLAPTRNNPWDDPDLDRIGRVIAFLQDLTITSGPAAFTKLEVRHWQRKFLAAVYAETHGRRPVRTAVLSMGRKCGKTQLAAALALCHLSGPESESRGESIRVPMIDSKPDEFSVR